MPWQDKTCWVPVKERRGSSFCPADLRSDSLGCSGVYMPQIYICEFTLTARLKRYVPVNILLTQKGGREGRNLTILQNQISANVCNTTKPPPATVHANIKDKTLFTWISGLTPNWSRQRTFNLPSVVEGCYAYAITQNTSLKNGLKQPLLYKGQRSHTLEDLTQCSGVT